MEIASSLPGVPELPLGGFMPNDDPVQIRNIEGLGPVKADVALTPYATGRGELFQGSSTPKRNIVLTLGLNPNWTDQTMASLRQLLYRYFMPENWGTFKFFTNEIPPVYINGVVESFEPNIFSQDPEIQVSILCPKPDFIDSGATFVNGVSGGLIGAAPVTIEYEGTAPTGFIIRVTPTNPLAEYSGNIGIINTMGGQQQELTVQMATLNFPDFVEVSTTKTSRYIYQYTGRPTPTTVTDIMAKLIISSDWPELKPGPNVFQVVHDIFASSSLDWRMGYFNRFGGL
jgi:hypothetical protein